MVPFLQLKDDNQLTSLPSEIGLMTGLQTLNLSELNVLLCLIQCCCWWWFNVELVIVRTRLWLKSWHSLAFCKLHTLLIIWFHSFNSKITINLHHYRLRLVWWLAFKHLKWVSYFYNHFVWSIVVVGSGLMLN